MSGVPNVFGSATSSIPLSQLDVNFNTPVTIGNTTVGLGNVVTSLGNVTLVNATLTSANVSISGGSANGVVYVNSSNVAVASPTVLDFDGTNLGLGVTPSAWSLGKAFEIGSAGNSIWGRTAIVEYLSGGYYNSGYKYGNTGNAVCSYQQNSGSHIWSTAPSGTAGNAITFTQAMTLNASGNYFLGTTTNGINTSRASIFNDSSNNTATFAAQSGTAASIANMVCYHGAASGATAATQIAFLNGGATQVGSITSTGSVTAFNPSSDKRLKDNIQSMTDGLNRVMKLKPVTFVWKENGEVDDGFIAQDLQETTEFKHRVNPIGERNGEMYYGVDYMRFVSVLTAAIQEQQAMITTLQSQVTALQTKVGV